LLWGNLIQVGQIRSQLLKDVKSVLRLYLAKGLLDNQRFSTQDSIDYWICHRLLTSAVKNLKSIVQSSQHMNIVNYKINFPVVEPNPNKRPAAMISMSKMKRTIILNGKQDHSSTNTNPKNSNQSMEKRTRGNKFYVTPPKLTAEAFLL